MVSINPTSPIITPASSKSPPQNRQVVPTSATGKRDRQSAASNERRRYTERRARRGSQRVMDRRLGAERRRSRIDLSV